MLKKESTDKYHVILESPKQEKGRSRWLIRLQYTHDFKLSILFSFSFYVSKDASMGNVVQCRYTISMRGLRARWNPLVVLISRLHLGHTRLLGGYGHITHSLLLYFL